MILLEAIGYILFLLFAPQVGLILVFTAFVLVGAAITKVYDLGKGLYLDAHSERPLNKGSEVVAKVNS